MEEDFYQKLERAVTSARNALSEGNPGMDLSDDRAKAYLDIARVLLVEGNRTGNANYIAAARQLQEQAEITTYSGKNGTAAIVGNLNAKLNNPKLYNLPLDAFSYEIDNAVVSFFERVVLRGDYSSISGANVMAVDALVWDRYGLLDYFPGQAIGLDFTAGTETSVWGGALEGQRARLQGTTSKWNIFDSNLHAVGAAIGSPQILSIGKQPASLGFTDPEVIKNLPMGGALYATVNGRGWILRRDDLNVVTIAEAATGKIAYIDNGVDMASWTDNLGLIILGGTFPAQLFAGFVKPTPMAMGPDQEVSNNYILDQAGLDKLKDFLGADRGPLGVRFRYLDPNVTETVTTVEELFRATPHADIRKHPYLTVIPNPNRPGEVLIVGRRDNVDGTSVVVSIEGRETAGTGLVTGKKTTLKVDATGTLVGASVEDGGTTTVLDLAQANFAKERLEAFAREVLAQQAAPKLEYDLTGLLLDDTVTGGGPADSIRRSFLTARVDAQGNLILEGHATRRLGFDPRTGVGRYAVDAGPDSYGRATTQEWHFNPTTGAYQDAGVVRTIDGGVEIMARRNGATTIRLQGSPVGLDFVDAAGALASTFGRYLVGNDALAQILVSASLQTVASNLGDILNTVAFDSKIATGKNITDALEGLDSELLANLKSSGLGAVSAFLTAELVNALGVSGFAAEALNSAAGYAIGNIITNLGEIAAGEVGVGLFDNIGIAQLGNVAGSFLGNQLASKIGDWDEIGEQLGASIGGTLGGIAAPTITNAIFGQVVFPIPVLGAIIGSFLGNLLGGLIGGLFTGTPKSGAILGYDEEEGEFAVQTVWKKSGGKKSVATELGNAAAEAMNGIISFVGGDLLNASTINAGSYGMRGKRYVYWADGTDSDNRVKFKSAQDLIEYGVVRAARDFSFIGGDIFAKRAFYNTIASGVLETITPETGTGPQLYEGQLYDGQDITNVDFGLDVLLGNFAVVDRLKTYLKGSTAINALIAAEPNSGFAADWLLALSRANDLGLLKRHNRDWDGGFSYLLDKGSVDARDVQFEFDASANARTGERLIHLKAGVLTDTIDSGSKTVIDGSSADDFITAFSGGTRTGTARPGDSAHVANVFRGGDGKDRISAGDTGDDLFGGDGDDQLIGGAIDDWLFGEGGDDVLAAGEGSGNVLSGGSGNDRLIGADAPVDNPLGKGADWLVGGGGADEMFGRGGDDYFEGKTGNDWMDGGNGSDTFIYRRGDGVDLVGDTGSGANERDVLLFGRGIVSSEVRVIARSAGEQLSLVLGNIADGNRIDLRGVIFAERHGIEVFKFDDATWSRGDVTSRAIFSKTAGTDVNGTAANESLAGTEHDDRLTGGGGSDVLKGGFGSDRYTFQLGDGTVEIDDVGFAADVDALVFGAGIAASDILVEHSAEAPQDVVLRIAGTTDRIVLRHQSLSDGTGSIEEVRFADGTSLTLRDLMNRYLAPAFTGGADTRLGFDGPDTFVSGDGDDVLRGGRGDDNLEGEFGADIYRYSLGDGNDRIRDASQAWGGAVAYNRLEFGAGITAADLVFTRDPNDAKNLRITFRAAPGSLLLDDQFGVDSWAGIAVPSGIHTIGFADGTEWDRTTLEAAVAAQSVSARNDIVDGTYLRDVINGGAGDDLIFTGDGDDDLTGGQGNDNLEGGFGADVYHYAVGDGHDRIRDSSMGGWGAVAYNSLELGAGIAATDLILTRDPNDLRNLRITFANSAGSITIDEQFGADSFAYNVVPSGIHLIRFADGSSWDRAAIEAAVQAQAVSSGKDLIEGTYHADEIDGGAGSDIIIGGNGDDILSGGAGNDRLDGGNGADIYRYGLGDGHDVIAQDASISGAGAHWNTLELGAGISADDLILTRGVDDSRDLWIHFRNAAGSILIEDQYGTSSYAFDIGQNGVNSIRFADGTVWSRETLEAAVMAQAISSGGDIVHGSFAADVIASGAGNDTVFAGGGNDTLTGGTGDDFLDGGGGADTYVYAIGDGFDRIRESQDQNRIRFGAGITAADLVFSRVLGTDDLLITFAGAAGGIVIEQQLYYHVVTTLEFADGSTLDKSVFESASMAPAVIDGTSANDTLAGTAASELLQGGDGSDILTGGGGADRLEGGALSDIYIFNPGDGRDIISDQQGSNVIRFGAGIDPLALVISAVRHDGLDRGILIAVSGTNDSIFLEGAAAFTDPQAVRIEFANGTLWSAADLVTRLVAQADGDEILRARSNDPSNLAGGSGDDRLYGGYGNDTLSGGAGTDRMEGFNGADTYLFNLGDGRDSIWDAGGLDTVRFGAGIDPADLLLSPTLEDDIFGVVIRFANSSDELYIIGQNANDWRIERFEFANGTVWTEAQFRAAFYAQNSTADDDLLRGSQAGDTIAGGAGDDRIYGDYGDDILAGGTGSDKLEGGAGNDTYLFNRGDGMDNLWDSGGNDTLRFGAGISAADLELSYGRQDDDTYSVIISIRGTQDRLYIAWARTNDSRIERFEFADGTVWTDADFRAALYAQNVTAGDDWFDGSDASDNIRGGGGDDKLFGGNGDDTLAGEAGSDRLEGGWGNDTYVFGRGDGRDAIWDAGGIDTIRFEIGVVASDIRVSRGQQDGDTGAVVFTISGTEDQLYVAWQQFSDARIENFTFTDGTVWDWQTVTKLLEGTVIGGVLVPVSMGDDVVIGTSGADTLRGMKGDDVLRGGGGSDIYRIARGDGSDVIYDAADAGSIDRLVLEGILSSDVTVLTSPTDADDVVLYIDDDTIIYLDQQKAGTVAGIDEIEFANGEIWSWSTLNGFAQGRVGSENADTLLGSNFADTIEGKQGDDLLSGRGGGDTYVYALGDGNDTIIESPGGVSGADQDVIRLGAGFALGNLHLARSGTDDLKLSFGSLGGSLLLLGQERGAGQGVEKILFADSSSVTLDALRQLQIDAAATAGDDVIEGFVTNDILSGAHGNDLLKGGKGSDTYRFGLGDGIDTVEDREGSNRLLLGAGIAAADIRLLRSAGAPADLILIVGTGGDRVVLKGQFAAGGVDTVELADGTTWSRAQLLERILAQPATAEGDYLLGSSGNNTLDGLGGDDLIDGDSGDDTLYGGAGNDTLFGGAGKDILNGGDGDDVLAGEAGDDTLNGGDGFDTADYGGSREQWLIDLVAGTAKTVGSATAIEETLTSIEAVTGGLGADEIRGDDNVNHLRGAEGNDLLVGRGGDDVFLVNGDEDGFDIFDGGAGYDQIEAMSDDTLIGIAGLSNVECITGNGFAGVIVGGTDSTDSLDLSAVALDGVSKVLLGAGNDLLVAGSGANVIDAGLGNDTVRLAATVMGVHDIDGGDGVDRIEAGSDNLIMELRTLANIEAVSGAGHTGIVVRRTNAAESTNLSEIAFDGIARFELEGGDDTFVGDGQANVVRGGGGDDTLSGHGGDDIFEFSGIDEGRDAIDGGAGFDTLRAVADGTIIGLRSLAGVEAISGNGHANVTIALTASDDSVDFSAVALSGVAGIRGGAGDDTLRGSAGDDVFLYSGIGEGLDDINGDGGADRIEAIADGTTIGLKRMANIEAISSGGFNNVGIELTSGNDSLDFSGIVLSGMARIAAGGGNDNLTGSAGDDVLVGGQGNDTLSGGQGNDTYRFELGDGHDVISDQPSGGVGAGSDILELGAGITVAMVEVTTANEGRDFLLSINGGTDTIRLVNAASAQENYWIEQIRFADGTIWTRETLGGNTLPYTAGDDVIDGTPDADSLRGGGGNDTLRGLGGNDTLRGDEGNDTLDGGSGNDRVIGGTGNDEIWEGEGDDTYVWNLGDGDDVIRNGGWWDGFNTVEFGPGITATDLRYELINDGRDLRISVAGQPGSVTLEGAFTSWDGERVDRLLFADGSSLSKSAYVAAAIAARPTGGNDGIQGSTFSDMLEGGAGNDWFDPRQGNDRVIGGTGNDEIWEGEGDDTYVWNLGDGDDLIRNGGWWDGFNTVEFGPGITATDLRYELINDGRDLRISVAGQPGSVTLEGAFTSWDGERVDRLLFADGSSLSKSAYVAAAIAARPTGGNDGIQGSTFSDMLEGGAGNDWFDPRQGNDRVIGGTGNDEIWEGEGDDTYVWNLGDGDDLIRNGGSWDGFNTVEFGPGITATDLRYELINDGRDLRISVAGQPGSVTLEGAFTSWDGERVDRLLFADGSSLSKSAYLAAAIAARPTSGNDSLYGSVFAETLEGGAGNDTIDGRQGNDVLNGGTGNDFLSGGGDNDVYRFARGDGHDIVQDYIGGSWGGSDAIEFGPGIVPGDITVTTANAGNDYVLILDDGSGSVTIRGGVTDGNQRIEEVRFADGTIWTYADLAPRVVPVSNGADVVIGTAGADTLRGLAGADKMTGLAGDDVLRGDAGGDILSGGDGDDLLYGGSGADLIMGDTLEFVATGANLLVNGSFEQSGTVVGGGGWGIANATMPGWTKANGQPFEQCYAQSGVSPTDGTYWLDMDSAGGAGSNMEFSQTVGNLTAGQVMLLQFDHANRVSEASGGFEVHWNGILVAAINATGTQMRTSSFEVVAVTGDNVLTFKATGAEDNGGASLDNVRLFATVETASGSGNDILEGGGDDLLWGGGGDDLLWGGGGSDIARFVGNSTEYQITANGDGSYTVQDLIADRDGTDVLRDIEIMRFADSDFAPLDLVGGSGSLLAQRSGGAVNGGVDMLSQLYPSFTASAGDDGRFALRHAFSTPGLIVSVDTQQPPEQADMRIQSAASVLVQSIVSFAPTSAAEAATQNPIGTGERDFWLARADAGNRAAVF